MRSLLAFLWEIPWPVKRFLLKATACVVAFAAPCYFFWVIAANARFESGAREAQVIALPAAPSPPLETPIPKKFVSAEPGPLPAATPTAPLPSESPSEKHHTGAQRVEKKIDDLKASGLVRDAQSVAPEVRERIEDKLGQMILIAHPDSGGRSYRWNSLACDRRVDNAEKHDPIVVSGAFQFIGLGVKHAPESVLAYFNGSSPYHLEKLIWDGVEVPVSKFDPSAPALIDPPKKLPVISPSPQRTIRTFKSADGKFSVEAIFVHKIGDTVALKKSDGSKIDVPFEVLSQIDREWISAGAYRSKTESLDK